MCESVNAGKFHHIGYAVRNISASEEAFTSLGAVFDRRVTDKDRNLEFSFGHMGECMIELVSPYDIKEKCAVTGYIEKQQCSPYHVCFTTDNIEIEISRLRKKGFRQVGNIINSDIYGYTTTGTFMYSLGTGLIEIVMEQ